MLSTPRARNSVLLAFTALLGLALVLEPWRLSDATPGRPLLGALVGATSGVLFLYGLRRTPAEHAGILTLIEPLSAVLVAFAAFGERPGSIALLGGLIVLGSGVLAVRRQSA